jgi:hypothetical protein
MMVIKFLWNCVMRSTCPVERGGLGGVDQLYIIKMGELVWIAFQRGHLGA